MSRWIATTVLVALLWLPRAEAAGPKLVLDRVEAESSPFGNLVRLRLFVTAVTLEGSVIPVAGDGAWALVIGSSKAREPYLAGQYGGTDDALALAIVVETSFDYANDLPTIQTGLKELIGRLPASAQIAVSSYGEEVSGGTRFVAQGSAAAAIEALDADSGPSELKLLKAIERALRTFDKLARDKDAPPRRKAIIVVSDGVDENPVPSRYRELGEKAARAGVRIHTVAFSPIDSRRPLLGLGELSKRSHGTFRWVREAARFSGQLKTLSDEIARQYVLLFYVKRGAIDGKRVKVRFRELESNEARVDGIKCGAASCPSTQFCAHYQCIDRRIEASGGWIKWAGAIGGGVVGLLFLLWIVGFLMSRGDREAEAAAAFAAAAAAAAGGQPQTPNSHRISPAGPQGQAPPAQVAAAAGMAAAAAAIGPGGNTTAQFYVESGHYSGHKLRIKHGFKIGTQRGCDLFLSGDPYAAPEHAVILVDQNGTCTLVDRGSQTGTFVNGNRVAQVVLQHGMLIRIGMAEMRFMAR
jgi:hypothetical protein